MKLMLYVRIVNSKIYIYRNENNDLFKSLNIFNNNSYKYWRSHLCLDFVYSMEKVLKMTNSTHIMWLEDDTILTKDFEDVFLTENSDITNYSHLGFCCLVFERSVLIKFLEFIKLNYLKDIPLDWMLDKLGLTWKKSKVKCAFHIGKISSRKDNIVRIVENIIRC